MAGVDFSYAPGEVVDVSRDAAEAWIERGSAEAVEGKRTASSNKAKRRKRAVK